MKKTFRTKKESVNNKEQEILDWKKRYELIAEASGQIVYDYNLTDGSIEWSGSIEKVLGYKLSEMNGGIKQWKKLIHKDDRKEAVRLLEIAEKNLMPYEIEYRYKHKDGHYVIFLDRGLFTSKTGEKPGKMVGMMQDISLQKRSKKLITGLNTAALEIQKVISKEDIFKVVARKLKEMNIESMVSLVDEERKNIFFKYFSYDSKLIRVAEKIAGMKASDLFIAISTFKEYNDVINHKKTLLINSSVDFIRQILPEKIKFMAGQVTKMFKISRFIIAPLITDDVVFGMFSVQAEDILESDIPAVTMFANQLAGAWHKGELIEEIQKDFKERKKAEKALKESEEKSRTIIEQLSEGFALIDETGRITEWNEAMEKISGRKRKDAVGLFFWEMQYEHTVPELRGPDKFSGADKFLLESLKSRNSEKFNKSFEVPFLNMNGKRRIISSTLFPIFLGEKFFVGNVSRDITEQRKSELVLLQSEERFSKVFKSSPYAISVSELNSGKYIDVNDKFIELIGYEKEYVIGKNSIELDLWINSENRNKVANELREKGLIKDIETDFKSKSGKIRTWKSSLEIIELNERPCILSMIEDITDRKKTDIVLRQSEERFSKAFKSSPFAITISDLETGHYIDINESFEKFTGYSREEIVGRSAPELELWGTEETGANMTEELYKKGSINNIKAEAKCKSGEKRYCRASLEIIELNQRSCILSMIEDITEQMKSEDKLDESNRKLNTLINNLSGVVYRCRNDKQWTMEFISEGIRELSGYSSVDFILNKVRTFDSIIEPDERPGVWNEIQNALEENVPFTVEYKINCANGEHKWVWERGRGIYDGDKLIALEGYITDITEQRTATQALRDSEETLRTFINALSEPAFLLDKNYRFLLANKSLASGFNLSADELVGKNIFSVFKKDDAERRVNYIDKVLHTEEPAVFEDSSNNLFYINYVYPVFDEGKRVSKVAVFAVDITSRLKAEKENLLLAQTLKSVKDAISLTDMNNNVIFVNDAFLETYGFLEEEVIGKNISIVNPKGFHAVSDAIHKKTIGGGYHDELINIRKDGSEFPIELWTSTVKNSEDMVIATVGVARDISIRKKAEEELRKSQEHLRLFFNQSLEGYYFTLFDEPQEWNKNTDKEKVLDYAYTNQKIVEINDAMLIQYGASRKDLLGKPISILFEHDTEYGRSYRRKLFDEGRLHTKTSERKFDGTPIFIEGDYVCLYDEQHRIKGTFGIQRDITAREQAEEILQITKKTYQDIFNTLNEAIYILDDEGKFIDVNKGSELMYQYSRDELIGQSPASVAAPSLNNLEKIFDLMTDVKKTGNTARFDFWAKRKNGEIFPKEVIVNRGKYFNKDVLIATARDITERKRAEEELIKARDRAEEMNRVKTNFLANMSHEVRTPLVAILGFSEVLSGIIKEEELRNYVNMIHTGGERLLDTLNLILDLSVIEAQKVKIELSPLNIVEEVRQVVALFEKTASRKQLRLSIDSEFEAFTINLDEKILRQILNNLINNAIKYTKAGQINVKLSKEKREGYEYFAVRVDDTGIGIPENKKSLIWEEFRQVSEGLNRSFEGAGLGLSITKKFVEKLGGKIFLEKGEVDVGSTFTVMFPVTVKKETAGDLGREIKTPPLKKLKPEILYIEDDPIAIDIVKTFIKDTYTIDGASTGLEGIEKAKNKKYDAIFMDINLGKDMDGLEATKIIREMPGYKTIPIVAITAFAMLGDREEFFEKGCSHYISKPFTKDEFRQMISEIIPVKK
jgi:PAS domain S-box-containing protein